MAERNISSNESDIETAEAATEATVSIPTSNWWSPWLDVAKSKSSEVYEFMKKDFTDLSEVVKTEASLVVNSTAAVLKDTLKLEEPQSTANSLKKSVSSFLDSVSNVLNPLPDDEGEEAILIQNDIPVALSKFQLKLNELTKDPRCYLEPISEDQIPQFTSWLTIGDEQMTADKLSKLMAACPDLHDHYVNLVPEQLSHVDFWRRYLFRKALLEDEESFLEAKEKREKQLADKVQWEKENFSKGADISEEEQIKLLSEYENEKNQKSPIKLLSASASEDLVMKERQGMVVIGDSQCSTSSADTESKDTDDWEKDFDIEDADVSSK